jgi:ABC-type methionine transport system ATPase subunit
MEPMIQVENLCKRFETKGGTVEAAKNISFSIEKGEIFGIIGLSGAGKSTLVRCLNLLERPTSGTVKISNGGVSQDGTTMTVGNYNVKYNQEKNQKNK